MQYLYDPNESRLYNQNKPENYKKVDLYMYQ